MRKLILLAVVLLAVLGVLSFLSNYASLLDLKTGIVQLPQEKVKIVTEESVVIETVKKVGPSVVTVAEEASSFGGQGFNFGPFSIFGLPQQDQSSEPQNIGSGFVISTDGLIVTNKHVVSDKGVKYQIITNDEKKFEVKQIYRDPLNDVAILKIDLSQNPGVTLKPVSLGDSSNLSVGQFVIAIGTALGEFRNTVTTGVISGLGRGITAGSVFQGYAERLDNVIQTDAAINPGNSGGPLLNSRGEAIGINTAIAQSGQNIGFALPINIVKDSLKSFNEGGQFNRPYLGIAYKMLDKNVALLNNVPVGAYVEGVVSPSPAEKSGIKTGDIIIEMDSERIENGKDEPSKIIAGKKVGDTLEISLWRDGKTLDLKATLTSAPSQ